MRKLSEINIAGKTVIVRELTVTQVEKQFGNLAEQSEPTTLDWLFADDYMPEALLDEIIDQPVAGLLTDEVSPSELEPLYKEAQRINPFLAKALKQMRRIATLMEGLQMPDGSGPPQST